MTYTSQPQSTSPSFLKQPTTVTAMALFALSLLVFGIKYNYFTNVDWVQELLNAIWNTLLGASLVAVVVAIFGLEVARFIASNINGTNSAETR